MYTYIYIGDKVVVGDKAEIGIGWNSGTQIQEFVLDKYVLGSGTDVEKFTFEVVVRSRGISM